MPKITFTDKNTGDQLTAVDVNEIKNAVNANADLINSVTSSQTPPSSSSENDLWYNTATGKLFIYYNDGNTSQWVEVSSAL